MSYKVIRNTNIFGKIETEVEATGLTHEEATKHVENAKQVEARLNIPIKSIFIIEKEKHFMKKN